MTPNVVWTRSAESRLGTALVRTVYPDGSPPRAAPEELADISRRLALAFPTATAAIVLNYYVGFKHRPNEHILQVDVRYPASSNTYVVKLAGHARLHREHLNWQSLQISDSNPVFLPLLACSSGDPPQLVAIAYQDAGKHIGHEETIWLETAVLRCVRFDTPSLDSIRDALRGMYAQLARVYASARLVAAPSTGVETVPLKNGSGRHVLATSLERWGEAGSLRIRQRVNAAFAVGCTDFIDPVDCFRFFDEELAAGVDAVPSVHRGLAHGDLHGRNSLIGIDEQERANFPTLFDYESITADNMIGWDYVEMETELKIRTYEAVFGSGTMVALARHVERFETELNAKTLRCFESKSWDAETAAGSTPRERLMSILLTIRREACPTLGRSRAGSREWLREYLFLLGCYGLTTVRYDNQTELQRAAAYVSAGVAAAHLYSLRGHRAGAAPDDLSARYASYHVPLMAVRKWSRGQSAEDRDRAEAMLLQLKGRHPAALHVAYERIFLMAKRGADALGELKALHGEYDGHLDEDTFSLWGRCFKQSADRHWAAGDKAPEPSAVRRSEFQEADFQFHLAIEQYEKAYAVNAGFFPGINVATLTFLRAGLCAQLGRREESSNLKGRAAEKAQELIDGASWWRPAQPDDAVWMRATEAEAAMLVGNAEFAVERYRLALAQIESGHHHPQSMGVQLRRILDGYRLLGEPISPEVFRELPLYPYLIPPA